MLPADELRRPASDGGGGVGGAGNNSTVSTVSTTSVKSDQQKMENEFSMDQLRHHCRTCLSKAWATADSSDISIVPVRLYSGGGLSNYLFVASLADTVQPQAGEPNRVLIRVFGEILSGNAESVVLDSVIFALLSEKRMGPHLYGVFKGGRIEEFVADSAPLRREQLAEPLIHGIISKHLARLHRLEMPLPKQPQFVFKMMESWLRSVAAVLNGETGREVPAPRPGFNATPVAQFLQDYRVNEEIEWLREVFYNQLESPIVFCHNDLQENNILKFDNASRRHGFSLQLIDFEYCSYNWRAFDIGNFFNEWSMDYTPSEWPYFSYHPESFPSTEAQLSFWKSYLRWFSEPAIDKKVPIFPTYGSSESEDDLGTDTVADDEFSEATENDSAAESDSVENKEAAALLLEAKYGVLMSHFFWSVWSLLQASVSSIHFDFREYAQVRFRLYAKLKEEITGKPSGLPVQ